MQKVENKSKFRALMSRVAHIMMAVAFGVTSFSTMTSLCWDNKAAAEAVLWGIARKNFC